MIKKDAKKNEKKERKLKLSRETLRNLTVDELKRAQGGMKKPGGDSIEPWVLSGCEC